MLVRYITESDVGSDPPARIEGNPMSVPPRASASRPIRPRADGVTALLASTLQLAVPPHIHELAGLDTEQLREAADGCADPVVAHGDDLRFGGPRCAAAFNALARGLAVLAYRPEPGRERR
jgi:hypothetical protein